MTITLDMGVLASVALVVGGYIIALARQVSTLTADVSQLVKALAIEREERQAADIMEADRRETSVNALHDRIHSITMQTRVR